MGEARAGEGASAGAGGTGTCGATGGIGWGMTFSALLLSVITSGAFAADAPNKDFVLNDGTHVVGVVIDEGESGYLVRTASGTVRIAYVDIAGSSIVAPGAIPAIAQGPPSAPPPPVPAVYVSSDGFQFPSAESMATYEIRHCKLDVLDARSGSWQQQGVTRIAPITGGPTTSSATGQFVDSVVAQYRVSTGEGVVLATFSGPMLYQSKHLFEYLGRMDAWNAHSHHEGADEDVRHAHRVMEGASAGVVAAGVITSVAAVAVNATLDPGTAEHSAAPAVGVGIGLMGTGLMWNILNRVPAAGHLVADPWNVEDVMPHVRDYNTSLRQQLTSVAPPP